MEEYKRILKDYVELAKVYKNIYHQETKSHLKDFLDAYFEDVICEYSITNKMSLEEIIVCQIQTGFYEYRVNDFKQLLEEFKDCIDFERFD
jgi:hypothetical protein